MTESSQGGNGAVWPPPPVLVICAVLLVAGYGVAVLRGPARAQEVRMVEVPAPTAEPDAAGPTE